MTAPASTLTPESILGHKAPIAPKLESYGQGPEQLQMAGAVAEAIRSKTHLIVEAGTGVGKSFAYLVPAILAAAASQVAKVAGDVQPSRQNAARPKIRSDDDEGE